VLRFVRILRDGHAPLRAHMFQPDYTIGITAGKDYADRALAVGLREGTEEKIDGHATPHRLLRRHEMQSALFESELMVRGNHVDVVRLHLHRLSHLHHRHRSLLRDDCRQIAFVFRREMHHDHEGQPAVRRHVAKEFLKHCDSTSRRAQTHYCRRFVRVAPLLRSITRVLARIVAGRGIEHLGRWLFLGHDFVGTQTTPRTGTFLRKPPLFRTAARVSRRSHSLESSSETSRSSLPQKILLRKRRQAGGEMDIFGALWK
jgi:hypothetical protein